MKRNLDNYYFRVIRNGVADNVCWSDLTEIEMQECIKKFDREALIRFCIGLGKTIRDLGDQLDLAAED